MTETPPPPLVSCLMVTLALPERFEFIRRSIAGYCAQTHLPRELVMVVNGGTPQTRAALTAEAAALGRSDITIIDIPDRLTLGALRNVSVRAARGTLLCTWDDDDLAHPQRLECQVAALSASHAVAVALTEVIQFLADERRLYLTNWANTAPRVAPNTLMWRASSVVTYPEAGAEASLGEDLAMLRQLQAMGRIEVIGGAAHLYIYINHGGNTCSDEHHRMLIEKLAVSKGVIARREPQLRQGLAAHDFGPGILTFEGSNGQAFIVQN